MFSKKVENAIQFAVKAHAGQQDKSGAPYILHPLRVGLTFSLDSCMESHIIVGILHDVVEDCDVKLADLAVELDLTEDEVKAIDAITKRRGEDYLDYLVRVRADALASAVKIEDLEDNVIRLVDAHYLNQDDLRRLSKKYLIALEWLKKVGSGWNMGDLEHIEYRVNQMTPWYVKERLMKYVGVVV